MEDQPNSPSYEASGPDGGLNQPPPPTGSPVVTQAQAGMPPAGNGAWYSGPWPAPGIQPIESTKSAVARTAIKALTALAILFVLPILALVVMASAFAAIGSGSGESADSGSTPFRTYVTGDRFSETNLVAVPVMGGIMGEDRGGGGGFLSAATGVTYGYSIKETLLELAEDEDVDGVLLEIDSPGGTIFGSKAIADGVAAYQEKTDKPVLAYVSGISASGGMYAMAGADEIVADHGTLIGSIGVIFGPFVRYNDVVAVDGGILFGGVTTEGGIDYEFLTAGRSKDLGSPYRDMTAEERKVLEEGLDNAYDAFVTHVADGRDITESAIKDDMGALIFGEVQAREHGLIDSIGSREAAHNRLAELAGADGSSWRLDRATLGEPSFFDLLSARADEELDPAQSTRGATAQLPSMCSGSTTLLAYHGDPAALCASLLD